MIQFTSIIDFELRNINIIRVQVNIAITLHTCLPACHTNNSINLKIPYQLSRWFISSHDTHSRLNWEITDPLERTYSKHLYIWQDQERDSSYFQRYDRFRKFTIYKIRGYHFLGATPLIHYIFSINYTKTRFNDSSFLGLFDLVWRV